MFLSAVRTLCRIALNLPVMVAIAGALTITASQKITDIDNRAIPHVMVLYVGADDCAPCRAWHRDYRPGFFASTWFNQLEYREALSPTLFDVLKDEYWPETLRRYRSMLDEKDGVPIWFVVADDQVVLRAGGISQWETAVLPKIKSLFRL